ncbi:MAG: DUF1294 domain-containing protein [Candidatus Marinarcus sp.]|uniref:DUF1294 domain-containing protein n=1 Tax=Candidatus Marinarcus sp. TaxID=3100987 RepID=UPI003AFFBBAE
MNILFILFLFINILSFTLFGLDKYFAIKNRHRISEKTLHLLSFLGGFIGSTLAMMLFHHKVRKASFLFVHTLIVLFWIMFLYAQATYEFM